MNREPDLGADVVVVRTFANTVHAGLAASWLAAANIESMTLADDAGGAYPFLQVTRGVKVLVRSEDAARAREVLDTAEQGLD